jgi:hypothetical protein
VLVGAVTTVVPSMVTSLILVVADVEKIDVETDTAVVVECTVEEEICNMEEQNEDAMAFSCTASSNDSIRRHSRVEGAA